MTVEIVQAVGQWVVIPLCIAVVLYLLLWRM